MVWYISGSPYPSSQISRKYMYTHVRPWVDLGHHPINHPHRIPISLSIISHEPFEVYIWSTILCYDNIQFFLKIIYATPSSNCMSQHAMDNTLQYRLSYTWQALIIQSFKHFTWSNIIHEFSMFFPRLTSSSQASYHCLEGLHISWKQTLCPLIALGTDYHGRTWKQNVLWIS